MNALVIYPRDKTIVIEQPIGGETTGDKLNILWNMMNPDSGHPFVGELNEKFRAISPKGGWGVRSSMVGDIYALPNIQEGRLEYFMVDSLGFKQITQDQSIFLQSLEEGRTLSWKYLQERFPALGEPIKSFI